MRSRVRKVNSPTALELAIEQRLAELPYGSYSEYVNWLVFFDLMTRKDHAITGGLAKFSRAEIDRMHDKLAEKFALGETMAGSWLLHIAEEAAANVAGGKKVEANKVVEEMRRLIAEV